MGSKSKKSTTNFNQTQTPTPWAPAQPLLTDMLSRAQTAQANTPTTPVFSGPNADQTSAINFLRGMAPGLSAGAPVVQQQANRTGSGFYLDPTNNLALQGSGWSEQLNPALQGMIQAAINPLRDQLDTNVLSIGDAAKLAGAYGGDRQELLKGTALSRFNRDAMDVGSLYYGAAYENQQQRAFQANQGDFAQRAAAFEAERQRQAQVAQQFEAANRLALEPGRILGGIGDQQSQWDIAAAQAAIDAPWAGLDRYMSVLNSVQPYATTQTQGTQVTKGPAGGGLMGAASGALGGASAGAAFGPWGAGIGAVVGGLGGLFG